jgi:glutamine amidotransferase
LAAGIAKPGIAGMCELLGMSANVPTDIRFSFTGLMQRGGRTGPHRDGWGIAFYEGRRCRAFHDTNPSANSEIARLVRDYPIRSRITLSHIRRATHGRVCLANTHPFLREMWGREWAFVHHGRLSGIKRKPLSRWRPLGTTDSEHAFCWMLEGLAARLAGPSVGIGVLGGVIEVLAREVARLGPFNFLLSDSRVLYCYTTTGLCALTRRAPFSTARLIDAEMTVDFAKETTPHDVVTLVATRPLTRDETWTPLPRGRLIAFRDGRRVRLPVATGGARGHA